jgi:hypothetical protein
MGKRERPPLARWSEFLEKYAFRKPLEVGHFVAKNVTYADAVTLWLNVFCLLLNF